MKIKIISDSTCDLPQALIQQYDIGIVPLLVMKNEQEYIDGVTITPADIFAHVAAGGSLCSTAARSMAVYEDMFRQYAGQYDGILHINIGSGFSSSYQNACLAAAEFDNVRVIDSRNLSAGQGLVVLQACQLAETAQSMDALAAQLEAFAEKVEISFVVEKLDYLVKGGRCSSAAALGANLLNLKPCIEVKDGKMSVVKKYRGNLAKCLTAYIHDRLQNREDIDPGTLILIHTRVDSTPLVAAEDALASCPGFDEVYDATAGCTVSCHCGPGTWGVAFVRK